MQLQYKLFIHPFFGSPTVEALWDCTPVVRTRRLKKWGTTCGGCPQFRYIPQGRQLTNLVLSVSAQVSPTTEQVLLNNPRIHGASTYYNPTTVTIVSEGPTGHGCHLATRRTDLWSLKDSIKKVCSPPAATSWRYPLSHSALLVSKSPPHHPRTSYFSTRLCHYACDRYPGHHVRCHSWHRIRYEIQRSWSDTMHVQQVCERDQNPPPNMILVFFFRYGLEYQIWYYCGCGDRKLCSRNQYNLQRALS